MENQCRLCLEEPAFLKNVFENDSSIADCIEIICDVKIERDDFLLKKICCKETVNKNVYLSRV